MNHIWTQNMIWTWTSELYFLNSANCLNRVAFSSHIHVPLGIPLGSLVFSHLSEKHTDRGITLNYPPGVKVSVCDRLASCHKMPKVDCGYSETLTRRKHKPRNQKILESCLGRTWVEERLEEQFTAFFNEQIGKWRCMPVKTNNWTVMGVKTKL